MKENWKSRREAVVRADVIAKLLDDARSRLNTRIADVGRRANQPPAPLARGRYKQ